MASRGFPCFPTSLRVLVVDDDKASLKVLEKRLTKSTYQVRTCSLAQEALHILGQKQEFDIVLSDVNMSDMDGFEFLQHVARSMDLPVIMMSGDGETSKVMKAVEHGACHFLVKPIRFKEIRTIWHHVYRKRIRGTGGNIEGLAQEVEKTSTDHPPQQSDDAPSLFVGDDHIIDGAKKRKEFDGINERSVVKKARVVWTPYLHNKFEVAVDRLGPQAGPKEILELMGEPGLTKENVGSHLQKFRLKKSRSKKEADAPINQLSDPAPAVSSLTNTIAIYQQCTSELAALKQFSEQPHYTWTTTALPASPLHQFKPPFQTDHSFGHIPNCHVSDPLQWTTKNQNGEVIPHVIGGTGSALDPLDFFHPNHNFSNQYDPQTFHTEYPSSDPVNEMMRRGLYHP